MKYFLKSANFSNSMFFSLCSGKLFEAILLIYQGIWVHNHIPTHLKEETLVHLRTLYFFISMI